MKKTFRKAIAVLLAVLMVAFSVPFSALAGTPDSPDMFGETNYTVTKNRKWWVDDGVDSSLSKLQSTPEYWSYNSDETYNTLGAWNLSFGARFEDYGNMDYEDHRNDYKPVVAATVSSQGTNAGMAEAIAKVKDKSDTSAIKNYAAQYCNNYYGFSDTTTNTIKSFEDVKDAGNILNPAKLKAGDRIAVTVEFGGFDVLQNGQFKGKFNKDYLKAAAYASPPSRGDTWKAVNSGAAGCIADGTAFYPTAVAFAGNNVNVEDGTFYGAVTGKAAVAGDQSVSNYIGATASGNKPFGKYGIVSFVYSFEVLQDCDLSEVFTFDTDISGTEFEPYYRTSLDGTGEPNNTNAVNPELFLITHDDTDSTFANWALIWTDYEKSETKSYTIKFTNAAGTVVDTQEVAEGATPTAPANTATKTESNKDGTHTVTTYSWPEISAASEDYEYKESATEGDAVKCTLSDYTVTKKATLVSEGETTSAACPDCGYVDVQKTAKLDGTAYYAALAAAQAVDGSKYTAESYAKVTAALETYAQATVEAYTDKTAVDAAAKALEDAVKGLEALPTTDVYTYTYNDGSTKEVTVDKGATPTAPDNTPAETKDNNNGTHTVTTYTWEKTGDFTYAEKATADTKECTYGEYTPVTPSTIVTAGTAKAECSVCNHEDTKALDKLEGSAYYNALSDASAKNASDYTEASYAELGKALALYNRNTVEAYTSQQDVNNATQAIRDAINALVKVYTITFTNAAGTVVNTQKVADGATPVVPADNTAATAAKSDGNAKTHSHTTYSWPAVSAATEDYDYKEVATKVTENCTEDEPVVTEPTLDKDGSKVTSCSVCGQVLKTETIPALKGVNVTVTEAKYGETTLNGETATAGKTTKVLVNSNVTLTAKANSNAEFVGWKVAGKLVSTDTTYTFAAVANTEVTPVFTETAETFVVVFIDMYGNVVDTQEVTSGADITVPTAPVYPGYTFDSWSLTNDQIAALTEGTTITANYVKDAAQTYTVKAAGATITVDGKEYTDVAEGVAYDAKVTVTKAGTTSWTVNGATVAYGESYSFFCGSDIELVAVKSDDDTVKTAITIIDTVQPSKSAPDVIFTATRVVADNETVVNQGFVYAKDPVADDLTLENVGNSASGTNAGKVKVAYNKTNFTQIGLDYGLNSMSGTIGARAFVTTRDAQGNVKTTYSDAVLYTYA